MENWQSLKKKRNTDYDFLSHYMWAENNESYKQLSKIVFLRFPAIFES